jgi:prophage maintenance system killer protein
VKDHPFNDGNKRVASFLFSLFLKKNGFHLKSDGTLKVNDSALAVLVVLIAESAPKERDQYLKLLVSVLRKR